MSAIDSVFPCIVNPTLFQEQSEGVDTFILPYIEKRFDSHLVTTVWELFKKPRTRVDPVCEILGVALIESLVLNSILVPIDRAELDRGLLTFRTPLGSNPNSLWPNLRSDGTQFVLVGAPHSSDAFATRSTIYGCYWVQKLIEVQSKSRFPFFGFILSLADEGSAPFFSRLSFVFELLSHYSRVPIFIGGDHSLTYAAFSKASVLYPNVHLLRFDAHADCAPINVCSGHEWPVNNANFVKHLQTKILKNKLHVFGIRSISGPRKETFEVSIMNDLRRTLSNLGDDPIYVSIDADVLNETAAPDVNYPISGGVTSNFLRKCLMEIFRNNSVIGLDFVEHCSNSSAPSKTAQTIAALISEIQIWDKNR